MILKVIDKDFSICKVKDYSLVDMANELLFIGKTTDENSLVCETQFVPSNAFKIDNGWIALKIEGILDFSLIGIIAKISSILADNKIGVFVVSTYNTDYILIKKCYLEKAVIKLKENGYEIK